MKEEFLGGRVSLHGSDCIEAMRSMAADSIDSCITDPPYHLASVVKRFGKPGSVAAKDYSGEKDGATGAYARASRGFMGKEWDGGDIAFRPETWEEVYRVLKPGAFMAVFGSSRGYHRMACAIEDAGFEIRDSLMFLYGTGFPKSQNVFEFIAKNLDEGEIAPVEWKGWGSALKPAFEPIVLARKPLSEKTIAENVLRWRTGALNVDATRIPVGNENIIPNIRDTSNANEGWVRPWMADKDKDANRQESAYATMQELGRFPANVVHDGSDEVIDAFPITTSGKPGIIRKGTNDGACYGAESRPPGTPMTGFGDSGSAARFFYSAKANRQDRAGSKHPTVKPLSLMQWLCRLVVPKGGTVIDPFAGTGTTGEAAWREGKRAILIERESEYQDDIRRRMRMADMGPDERARYETKMAEDHSSASNDNNKPEQVAA